jgi:hypothetical protein
MTTIACTLDQEGQRSRRERWLVLGTHALVAVTTSDRGLELGFAPEPGVEQELLELAELERHCCAFATWTVRPTSDRVVLDVAGSSDEGVLAVQGMFGALRELLATPKA